MLHRHGQAIFLVRKNCLSGKWLMAVLKNLQHSTLEIQHLRNNILPSCSKESSNKSQISYCLKPASLWHPAHWTFTKLCMIDEDLIVPCRIHMVSVIKEARNWWINSTQELYLKTRKLYCNWYITHRNNSSPSTSPLVQK